MTDIYLSYSEPNLELAKDLKKDVESCSSLSVALEDGDWFDDSDFQEHIDKAKMMILIATEHSNITAWVIDNDKNNGRRNNRRTPPRSMMKPPTLDFSSYEEGMMMLKYVLRVVIGARRFQTKRTSTATTTTTTTNKPTTLLKKDQKPVMPQRCASRSTLEDTKPKQEESPPKFTRVHQLPKSQSQNRDSSSSVLEAINENFQRFMGRVQGIGTTENL